MKSPEDEIAPPGWRVLIIGYGNPLRGDDGAGWAVAERLARLNDDPKARCWVMATHLLLPELADPVSRADLVLFVDASVELAPGEISLRDLSPPEVVSTSLMHHMSPEALLLCARRFFKRAPQGLLMSIGAGRFEHGQRLSPEVRDACGRAARQVRQLIRGTHRHLRREVGHA